MSEKRREEKVETKQTGKRDYLILSEQTRREANMGSTKAIMYHHAPVVVVVSASDMDAFFSLMQT